MLEVGELFLMDFPRGAMAETFPMPVVQRLFGLFQRLPGHAPEIRSLGKELSQEAVGVFDLAALPRAIRMREVDRQAGSRGQPLVIAKLFAVVKGHGAAQGVGKRRQALVDLPTNPPRLTIRRLWP